MVRKIMLAAMLLPIVGASLFAAEMTADDLIANYLTACGGESFRALKSMTMKGTIYVESQALDVKVSYTAPDKMYMENSMNGTVMQATATNGKDAWVKNPMGVFFMSGEDKVSAMRLANRFPLFDYGKSGAKVRYLGEDKVKGAKAYKLEYVGANNDTVIYFFDATTYLIVKEKYNDATVMMSKYKKVGDLIFPYNLNIKQAESIMIEFDTIAINVAIPGGLFVMPRDARSLDSLKAMMK